MTVSFGPQLSVTNMRRSVRYPVDYPMLGEHRQLGDVHLRILNISQQGFMAEGEHGLACGERIIICLPVIGRIEAHLAWVHGGRAGFQFERIIRRHDLTELIDKL